MKKKNYKKHKRNINWFRVIMCLLLLIAIILLIANTIRLNNLESYYHTVNSHSSELTEEEQNLINQKVLEALESYQIEGAIVDTTASPEIVSRGIASRREESIDTEITESEQLYRVTSYYPGDDCSSGTTTGSGKTIWDFDTMNVNGKTVYTYKGNIVVAAATYELLNTGYSDYGAQEAQDKHYFRYYDTFQILLDGTWYDAVVLDSCGASMWRDEYRIDIFVPDSSNTINRYDVNINVL